MCAKMEAWGVDEVTNVGPCVLRILDVPYLLSIVRMEYVSVVV